MTKSIKKNLYLPILEYDRKINNTNQKIDFNNSTKQLHILQKIDFNNLTKQLQIL